MTESAATHTCANRAKLVHDCLACIETRARMTSADIAQRMHVLMRRDYSESEPYRTNLMLAAIERLEKTR